MSVNAMSIQIPEREIADLRTRIQQTRWPYSVDRVGWEAGTDLEYLRDLTDYWGTAYDWREREARLNRLAHYLAQVDGVAIHFIHAAGQGASPVPLLLMQGWPSSFVQMLDIIPLLTEARDDGTPCFDVIAASLPGYLFSDLAVPPGMSFRRIADLMTSLMVDELGYARFAARGSDQGGLVQQQIGLKYPHRLIGLHRHGITPFANPMPGDLSPAETEYQKQVAAWAQVETAYARLQSLRPETLVPALADSPVGLASWIVEKFQRWGDCAEGIDKTFGRDALLDNLSLHWFCGAGASSIRLYRASALDPGQVGRVEVPTAIMMPLRDGVTVPAPREWAERSFDVKRWTTLEHGGHFPEWEVPHEVAKDIRQFFSEWI